jgi:acetylornithine deacetylase/succinyl-diaminopimelate desuccinylase-like protein
MMKGRLSDLIDENELVSLAQHLVRFPSPQTERMEAEPQVQAFIGDCVAPMLAQRGLNGQRDAMGNLVIEIGPESADRSLLLMAYAMTHPASAMADPYSGAMIDAPEGMAIRGRGISEQKGSLAAAIVAIACAQKLGKWHGRLVFALNSAGETGRHDAAIAILGGLRTTPALGVLALGTDNRVSLANKGRIDIEIVISGKAAHSSTPWLGVNAIDGARAVLDRLQALPLGSAAHPELGEATLTSTHISSVPNATHTIQNEVHLTFDRRLLPGQDPELPFDAIAAACAAIDGPWQIEVRRGAHMYPCEISRDGPLFRAITASRPLLGRPTPEVLYSHAALDAGLLVKRGCDATMWGPGRTAQFHADEEHLGVAELVSGAEDYLALIANTLIEP